MLALPRCAEQVLGSPADDRHAVADELLEDLFEVQLARLAVDERQEDDRDGFLQRRELKQLIEHDVRVGVLLDLDDQANRLFQVALVTNPGDTSDSIAADQFCDLFNDAISSLLEGDIADNQLGFPPFFDDVHMGPDDDRRTPGHVGFANVVSAADDPTGRKVRTRNDVAEFCDRHLGIINHAEQGVADFSQVVRWDARGHPHRDALCPIDQQIRKPRRQNDRFGTTIVIGWDEIDRVELDVLEHHRSRTCQTGFGVPHRSSGQTCDRTEVPLLVDQHMPHVPLLRHTDERRIDDRLAVRVVISRGVPGNLRTLDPRRSGGQAQVVHGDQNSTLAGLQPVANVWKSSADDNAHGIRQIAISQLVFDRLLNHPLATTPAVSGGR